MRAQAQPEVIRDSRGSHRCDSTRQPYSRPARGEADAPTRNTSTNRREPNVFVRARVGVMFVFLLAVSPADAPTHRSIRPHDPFWAHSVHVSAAVGVALPTAQFRDNFETAWDGGVTVAWPVAGHRRASGSRERPRTKVNY